MFQTLILFLTLYSRLKAIATTENQIFIFFLILLHLGRLLWVCVCVCSVRFNRHLNFNHESFSKNNSCYIKFLFYFMGKQLERIMRHSLKLEHEFTNLHDVSKSCKLRSVC